MDVITSRSNPTVKEVRSLRTGRGRRRTGRTLVEGPTLYREMCAAGLDASIIVATPDDTATYQSPGELLVVNDDVLASISDTETPQQPIAVLDVPDPRALRCHSTVVLVDVADPGNVGTIIRTARAFGWDAAVSGSTADPWSPKALRASAGAVFTVRPPRLDDPSDACRAVGLPVASLVVSGGAPPEHRDQPIALLVGSEAHGLPPRITDGTDLLLTIPMPGGTESLNAAVAAGIAIALTAGT